MVLDSEANKIIMQYGMPKLPSHLEEEEQARRLIAIVVARQATRFISNVTTSRVRLTSFQIQDGIKGKVVGKEGRNARHFEEKFGVDLLLNDEPDAIIISSFDPYRREVARIALEQLIRDGRIHPGRIEEFLNEARKQVEQEIRLAGQKAVSDLNLTEFHPAIIRILGTLKFRASFGQNQLEHSIETAGLCGSLAQELGYDVQVARRAGLLHDLGKGLDQTHDGGHAKAGADFAQRFGESDIIVQAIASHHEEIHPTSWLDHLLIAADALSGARPGARHGSTVAVLERAQTMEKIAMEVPGVVSAYAIQAGRELRVFVDSDKISDLEISQVAREIAQRCESDIRFPGQIKVMVLRESRAVEVISR